MNDSVTALPELCAHRGNAAEYPENTLEALGSAVELGLRWIELDVQLTADHVPVVIHDDDLQRVSGRPDSVLDLTWPQLAAIPVGEAQRFGDRYADVRVPSLSQFAAALAGWRGVTAFVEVKSESLERFGHELMLRKVAEAVAPVLDQCVLISFDLPAVRMLREMTGARIAWVLERYDDASRRLASELGPEYLYCDINDVPADATSLWPGPWHWAFWEVGDMATARRCQRLGARVVEMFNVRDMLRAYAEAGSGA
jgi:glycerophosphoryl diester phosphodiesterase